MRAHPATTPLHTTTTVCPEKTVGGMEMWEMIAQAWPPSNTWVKLIARRLAQQIKRRNRQTGSTTADSPRNLSIQTRQSRHHHRTVQHTVHCSSSDVMTSFRPPPLLMASFNVDMIGVFDAGPDYTRTSFLSTQENPRKP